LGLRRPFRGRRFGRGPLRRWHRFSRFGGRLRLIFHHCFLFRLLGGTFFWLIIIGAPEEGASRLQEALANARCLGGRFRRWFSALWARRSGWFSCFSRLVCHRR
jgi:hypothetical protein